MSYDLKLITKQQPNMVPIPNQANTPNEYFGEQSNDIQLGPLNDFDLVTGIEKLRQDIQKVFLTVRGKNTNFALYGTELQTLVGQKVDISYMKAKVTDEIIAGLQLVQYANQTNTNPDEKIATLEYLDVSQPGIDHINVDLTVITESNIRVTMRTALRA